MKGIPLSPPVRVHPFTGLVVDVDTWATAHDYHRRHHQLHLLTVHGSGIAAGLEVLPTDPPGDSLVIEPGVAIDDAGNVIIVPEAQRVSLDRGAPAQFIVLDYVESLPQAASANGAETRGRMVEDFRLRVLTSMPETFAVELARVQTGAGDKLVVVSPAIPMAPGANEIDGRFRPVVYPQAPAPLAVGLVVAGAPEELDPAHLRGFQNMLRELRHSGVRASFVTASSGEVPTADLLYVTGDGTASLAAKAATRLTEEAKRGAWIFADTCGPGVDLVQAVKAAIKDDKKSAAETQARVLAADAVFGGPPPGASATQEMIWGRNTVISPRDYGCAWAGRHGDQVLPREQIRSALEFGVNVAVAAARGTAP